ncbi:hypothetical protein LWI29_036434 [Acer saccharum]|uniref:Uncharacterized protein n=1 Tax=Acer saccharum TaxID=4024 RepID=A0AA39VBB5_ACESA|nr:hypothetical protein LWI29_036434 [Acer saccharum]
MRLSVGEVLEWIDLAAIQVLWCSGSRSGSGGDDNCCVYKFANLTRHQKSRRKTATSLIDRVKGGSMTSQNDKIAQAKRESKIWSPKLDTYSPNEGMCSPKIRYPESEGTRWTSTLGLNRLGKDTEINPKTFRRPRTIRNHKKESRPDP